MLMGNDDYHYAWICYFDCNVDVDDNDEQLYAWICYFDLNVDVDG